MYVFISQTCHQEANDFQIINKLNEIAEWVEQCNIQDFTNLFEMFQFPYYVKKGVAYRYRLLAKLMDIKLENQHYHIVVFLKLFHRKDKRYDTFFINAEQRGEDVFQQQKLDENNIKKKFIEHLEKQQNQQVVVPKNDITGYLYKLKNNYLKLHHHDVDNVFLEQLSWYSGLRPYLSTTQLSQVFKTIQQHINSKENTLDFTLPTVDASIQLQSYPKFELACHHLKTHNPNFIRQLPEEVLLDEKLWLQSQNFQLPLIFNRLQKQVIQQIFEETDSYPLLINAPANSGKTSLLAVLAAHFILQPRKSLTHLPCLFLCQSHEKTLLRQQIFDYLIFHQQANALPLVPDYLALKHLIDECCLDMYEYIQKAIDKKHQANFLAKNFVDESQFVALWQMHQRKLPHKVSQNYSPNLCWFVIQHLIKGEQNLYCDDKLYSETLNQNSILTATAFQEIYQHVWKNWYEPLANSQKLWDIHDGMSYLSQVELIKYQALLIDDSQQYNKFIIQTLLQYSLWSPYFQTQLVGNVPLIFAGNHHGAIPAQLYQWHDEIGTLLYRLFHSDETDSRLEIHKTIQQDYIFSQLNFNLQQQRCQLGLIGYASDLQNLPLVNLADVKVFFIENQQENLLHALISNSHINFIINKKQDDCLNYIKNESVFRHWFAWVDEDEFKKLPIQYHGINHLPTKSYSIALLDFSLPDLQQLSQSSSLDFFQRYRLDSQINLLRHVMQQGLQQIFIVGNQHEFEVWEQLLSGNVVLDTPMIVKANLDDIQQNYQQKMERLLTEKKLAQESTNCSQITQVMQKLYQCYQFVDFYQLFLRKCHLQEDFQPIFQKISLENQRELVCEYLWQYHPGVILQYADDISKSFRKNLYALQIALNKPLTIAWHTAFLQAIFQYQLQINLDSWKRRWKKILPKLLNQLLNQNEKLGEKAWQNIFLQLKQLKQSNLIDIPKHILAYCAYHAKQTDLALQLWEQSTSQAVDLPDIYYRLLLQHSTQIQQKINCFIQLNEMDNLKMLLQESDLNGLQASYWEQILPYLDEENELELTLKSLLPAIESQEILEKLLNYCKDNSSENFVTRLQRFKTLKACINSDWDVVIERLEHYQPVDQDVLYQKIVSFPFASKVTTVKNKSNKIFYHTFTVNDEVIDILYALNLNPHLAIMTSDDTLQRYQENLKIKKIFDSIRKIFTTVSKGDVEKIIWNCQIPAYRALFYLVEKSNEPLDILQLCISALLVGSHGSSSQKISDSFVLERLSIHLKRFQNLTLLSEMDNKLIEITIQPYKKLLKEIEIPENPYELPVIKTVEDLVKSILALTNQEHAKLQKQKQDAINAQKAKEAQEKYEAERLKQIEDNILLEKQRQAEQAAIKQQQEKQLQEKLQKEQQSKQLEQAIVEQPTEVNTAMSVEPLVDNHDDTDDTKPSKTQQSLVRLLNETNTDDESITDHADNPSDTVNSVDSMTPPTKTTAMTPTSDTPVHQTYYKAVSELHFFDWRVFISRSHQRMNLENLDTGEHLSIYLANQTLKSDWQFVQYDNVYDFYPLSLKITLHHQAVVIQHLTHGIDMTIHW